MKLRDYQLAASEAVFSYFENKSGSPLVVLPTGSGKSVCIADLVRQVLMDAPGEHVLILSHRREILQQDASKLQQLLPHISVGIFSAGLGQKRLRQVTVAGVQSLARLRQLPPFRLVIIDEAHLLPHGSEGIYRRVIAKLLEADPDVRVVGYSATPFRASGYLHEGDGRLFTDVCFEMPIQKLIDLGFLAPLVTKQTQTQADLSGVHMRGGEFVAGEAEAAMDRDELTQAAVAEMLRYGEHRKSWLVFCAGIDHAEHVCDALRAAGIDSRCLFGHTDLGVRDRTLRDFKEQRLRALVSVSALTTGFDAPCADLVVILRPIASASLWVQCLGRGMRPSPDTGKEDCLVLDFAGCVRRCGLVDDPIVPGQSRRKKDAEAPVKICPTCQTAVAPGVRNCPECDHEWEVIQTKHDFTASSAPILKAQAAALEVYAVFKTAYREHVKKAVDKDGEDIESVSMRVDYQCGLGCTISEWVCFEHAGFAQRKAATWWKAHCRQTFEDVPITVDEAIERQGQLKEPRSIAVRREGKFFRVLHVGYDDAPRREPVAEEPSELELAGI